MCVYVCMCVCVCVSLTLITKDSTVVGHGTAVDDISKESRVDGIKDNLGI